MAGYTGKGLKLTSSGKIFRISGMTAGSTQGLSTRRLCRAVVASAPQSPRHHAALLSALSTQNSKTCLGPSCWGTFSFLPAPSRGPFERCDLTPSSHNLFSHEDLNFLCTVRPFNSTSLKFSYPGAI